MSESNGSGFKQWCVVELFGHNVIAGLVGEQQIGGSSFVRVDVPQVNDGKAYTKFFGPGAIYAMTPTDEETCRRAIANMTQPPIEVWRLRETVNQPRLPMPDIEDEDEEDEDDIGF